VLDLSPGSVLVLDGRQWTVQLREPHLGRVVLAGPDGARQQVSMQFLASHPGCFTSSRTSAPGAGWGRQEAGPGDLVPGRRELAELRQAHLLEVATGFRSGSSLRPRPGEPKPEYDPDATTLTQRCHAKAAELAALDPEQAMLLGLDHAGYRTLIRWENGRRRAGLVGCADDRWLRESGGPQRLRADQGSDADGPGADTAPLPGDDENQACPGLPVHPRDVRRRGRVPRLPDVLPGLEGVVRAWRARPRNDGSDGLPAKAGHVVVSRPWQVLALDTTVLPVKVREGMFGDPVSVHLTLALDVYTHSLVAFRLILVSDTSVDVAMLLRDVMMPLPMREGWGPEMAWPYPGIPAAVVAEFAGYEPAGLPFFTPETVTTDHGSVYKSHLLREAQRVLGCNILPARTLRPQDKAACERAFGVIRQLLFEKLPGYAGVDVADRGADPEGDAQLTIEEMERMVASWIVGIWQDRVLHDCPPAWDPDGTHSPNTLFAASFAQAGFALEVPRPEPFYELLPAHYVSIDERRGVKIAAFGTTTRRSWPVTAAPGQAAEGSTRASGSSAATRGTGGPCSSRTRSPVHGIRCAGPGCPRPGRCRHSVTPGCAT
jgi:transposase InsO family protein